MDNLNHLWTFYGKGNKIFDFPLEGEISSSSVLKVCCSGILFYYVAKNLHHGMKNM